MLSFLASWLAASFFNLEGLAFFLGLISVWLTVRQNLWCWPIGLVQVALTFVVVLRADLLADAALQVFFFVIQIYGWYQWKHGGLGGAELAVSRTPRKLLVGLLCLIAVGGAGLGAVLDRSTRAALPYLDSTQALMSVVAQWMLARKYLENWQLWIAVNVMTILLYAKKSLYLLAFQYGVFLLMAVAGYLAWKRSLGEPTPRWLGRAALAGLAAFLSLAGWITLAGMKTDLHKVDCIIVPGARVEADGRLGHSLEGRMKHAVRLYREGWARALILTGGQGDSGAIESESARRWAIEQGVPPEACFVETRSHTTLENMLFAREVMREQGWRSCLVTTDPFHTARAVAMARQIGLVAYPAPSFEGPSWKHPVLWTFYTVRECFSWIKYSGERLLWTDPAPGASYDSRKDPAGAIVIRVLTDQGLDPQLGGQSRGPARGLEDSQANSRYPNANSVSSPAANSSICWESRFRP